MAKLESKKPTKDAKSADLPDTRLARGALLLAKWWSGPAVLVLLGTYAYMSTNQSSREQYLTNAARDYRNEMKTLTDENKKLKAETTESKYTQKTDVAVSDVKGVGQEIIDASNALGSMQGQTVDSGRYDDAMKVLVKYFGSEKRANLEWLKSPDWHLELNTQASFQSDSYPVIFTMVGSDGSIKGYVETTYKDSDRMFTLDRVIYTEVSND